MVSVLLQCHPRADAALGVTEAKNADERAGKLPLGPLVEELAPRLTRMAGPTGSALAAQRTAQSPGLKLLRADLMPVLVAVLARRFTDHRALPYAEFLALVTDDLDELRDAGFPLPQTAQQYVASWIRDGILIRRPTESRDETVELSRSAADAVRFVAAVEQPRSSVTSSRLANVTDLLSTLARDSDPVPTSRLEALRAQRDVLEAEIARVESGEFEPLSDAAASERLREILRLAEEVPGDFAKVADDLDHLNQALREQIINHEGSRGGVLERVFAGVDVIEESDAGRTFTAFHRLLLDPGLTDAFDEAVDAVLQRSFTQVLASQDAAFLRQFLTTLQRESAQVRQTLTSFSRSLRRFVETQEYREHKRLAAIIDRAEQAAFAALRELSPIHPTGREIDLTSVAISSIGSWSLHNPADLRSTAEVLAHDSGDLDIEQLRALVRLTEIDFPELQRAVAATVVDVPAPTVADVLARFPATQGLASVVGLLLLATEHATRAAGDEVWTWTSPTGRMKSVRAPRYVFREVPQHWSEP